MATSNAFFLMSSRFCTISQCFYLANVSDEINSFHAGGELCPRLQFGTDQADNMNFVAIWHSGGILDYV